MIGKHLRTFAPVLAVISILLAADVRRGDAKTVYVTKAGNDANGGFTWTAAKLTVQAGIDAAAYGDEIWVAAGTYVQCITLKSGTALYGGFAGNEVVLAARNPAANTTILDGNAIGSVVTVPAGATLTTRLDGFTIRNGSGTPLPDRDQTRHGGAVFCVGASATITNNILSGNRAFRGGAIHCSFSDPAVTANTIIDNAAEYLGGGICCENASPIIKGNVITGNSAGSGGGGGIWCQASSPTLCNNAITSNIAGHGAAFSCSGGSTPVLFNNTIAGNVASGNGGAIRCDTSSPTISNNTILANSAGSGLGGGLYCSVSPAVVANNIVAFNSSGLYCTGGVLSLRSNCVHNPGGANYEGLAAGPDDFEANPELVAADYGQVHLKPGSPCIDTGDDGAIGVGWADMDGQARLVGPHVDVGADEFTGTPAPFNPAIIRVSPSGHDNSDGSSWPMAKRTVQAGIDAAAAAGGGEVWVAAGTYTERITLEQWTFVYGGFAGDETGRSRRDPVARQTVLDGNAGGSVVTVSRSGYGWSVLDGFTVRNGKGNLSGGSRYGGGILCSYSSPIIRNNLITANTADDGAGIWCSAACALISNNRIVANTAYKQGGAISCWASTATICSNVISANTALAANGTGTGAGIHCSSTSRPVIAGNTVTGNRSGNSGAAIIVFCAAVISNNIVAFNSSGVYASLSTPTLQNNCVYNPGGVNYTGLSPGSNDISVDPQLLSADHGEMHLAGGSPCIDSGLDVAAKAGWIDMDGESRVQGGRVDIGADEFAGASPPYTVRVIRVGPGGNDANDGSSWAVPKRTVQAAIDSAASRGGGDIWVAAGTYVERITLKAWVHLYGGFNGTEPAREQRDWAANTTILDGAAGGSVVTATFPGYLWSTVDGFTIRNGTGTMVNLVYGYGGGVYCSFSSPVIRNNIITASRATGSYGRGGGIGCHVSAAVISHNVITANTAAGSLGDDGGGVFCYSSSLLLCDNVITHNTGGGVFCASSQASVHRNRISGNTARGGGGGICCSSGSPSIEANTITGNACGTTGGGAIYCNVSTAVILGNLIASNRTEGSGGGINCRSASPQIHCNTITGNASARDGGGIYSGLASPSIAGNIVAFNSSGIYQTGGTLALRNNCLFNPDGYDYKGLTAGVSDISLNPLFVDLPAEDYRLAADSPCIDAGYNPAVLGVAASDIAGRPRFLDDPATPDCRWSTGGCGTSPIVDMGAFEFVPGSPGDLDKDGDVDGEDFAVFRQCGSGPGILPADDCETGDLDRDGDVDQTDFGVLQRCFGGGG